MCRAKTNPLDQTHLHVDITTWHMMSSLSADLVGQWQRGGDALVEVVLAGALCCCCHCSPTLTERTLNGFTAP